MGQSQRKKNVPEKTWESWFNRKCRKVKLKRMTLLWQQWKNKAAKEKCYQARDEFRKICKERKKQIMKEEEEEEEEGKLKTVRSEKEV